MKKKIIFGILIFLFLIPSVSASFVHYIQLPNGFNMNQWLEVIEIDKDGSALVNAVLHFRADKSITLPQDIEFTLRFNSLADPNITDFRLGDVCFGDHPTLGRYNVKYSCGTDIPYSPQCESVDSTQKCPVDLNIPTHKTNSEQSLIINYTYKIPKFVEHFKGSEFYRFYLQMECSPTRPMFCAKKENIKALIILPAVTDRIEHEDIEFWNGNPRVYIITGNHENDHIGIKFNPYYYVDDSTTNRNLQLGILGSAFIGAIIGVLLQSFILTMRKTEKGKLMWWVIVILILNAILTFQVIHLLKIINWPTIIYLRYTIYIYISLILILGVLVYSLLKHKEKI